MKKDYIIPTIEVLLMQAQPLLAGSLYEEVDLSDDEVFKGYSRDLDLFEIGDKYEGGF